MTMCTFHDIDQRLSFFGLDGSITTVSGSTQLSYVASRLLPRTTDVLDCLDFFRDAVNDSDITVDQAHDSLYTAIMAHYHRIHTTYSSTKRFERDDWLGDISRCVEACALASFGLTSGMIPDMNAMNDGKWKLMNTMGKDHHKFIENHIFDYNTSGLKSTGKILCQGINDWDTDAIPSTIPFREALLYSIVRHCDAGRTTAYLRVLSGLHDHEQRCLHAYEHMVNMAIPVFDPDALGILLKAWANVDTGDISMDDVRKTIRLMEHQHGNVSDAIIHVLNGGLSTPEALFIVMKWASVSTSYENGLSYEFTSRAEISLHDISPRRLYESIDLPDDFVIENIRVNGWF